MIWYDMIRYDMIWYDMIWYDIYDMIYMGDSINGGFHKWMVYKGKSYKMDDLGVPLF